MRYISKRLTAVRWSTQTETNSLTTLTHIRGAQMTPPPWRKTWLRADSAVARLATALYVSHLLSLDKFLRLGGKDACTAEKRSSRPCGCFLPYRPTVMDHGRLLGVGIAPAMVGGG